MSITVIAKKEIDGRKIVLEKRDESKYFLCRRNCPEHPWGCAIAEIKPFSITKDKHPEDT